MLNRNAIVCLMLAIFIALGTVPGAVSANDDFESNNNINSASEISPGEYTGLELVSNENDYYALSVEQGETVNVTLTVPKQADGDEADNNPDLELMNANGNELDSGEGGLLSRALWC